MKTIGLVIAVGVASFAISSAVLSQTQDKSCCSEKVSCTSTTTAQAKPQAQQVVASQQEVRCPVTGKVITNVSKAPKIVYGGKTYYFASRQALETFRKNPARYANQTAQPSVRTADLTTTKNGSCCASEGKLTTASAEKKAGCCATEGKATTASADKKAGCCDSEGKATTASAEKKAGCCATEGKATTASAEKKEGCCAEKQSAPTASTAEQVSKPSDKLICPVSEEVIELDSAVVVEYNGKLYYTCCNGCKRKFLANAENYAKKAEQLSSLQGKPAEKAPAQN